jgi:tRNA (adenine22-N1)-methyltransferase
MSILDGRLAAVAAMVRQGSIVADIGSDHGYLACELVLRGVCPLAYACDINEAPLARAGATIEKHGLSGRVKALLSDGLCALSGVEVNDVVIAGMGGELIAKIVGDAPEFWRGDVRFILQPMSKAERLREWLYAAGFEIILESAVIAGRFVYPVMCAQYSQNPQKISNLFAWTGKIWDNTDMPSREYLWRVHRRVAKMARSQSEEFIRLERILRERLI